MDVSLRVVGPPVGVLVIRGVQIQEVREEASGRHLAGQLVEVEVAVFRLVVHAAFLFPSLNGEDGRLAIAYAFVGGQQNFAHHAASLGRGIRTVVDAGEYHLVATTRMDGVHVVDKGLHGLVHAAHGLVDGMLLGALASLQPVQRFLQIVHQRLVVQVFITLAVQVLQCFQFFDIRQAHVGSQIEVEGGNGLSAVHLVLAALHRDAGQHGGRLDAPSRPRSTVSGNESAVQDVVQRMLHAGQRLRRIVVLVMDVQIVVLHGVAALRRQQIVIDEGLGGLRCKLHHHTRRRVGIHIGILARHVVVLDVDDIQEDVARLGLTGYASLVAIGNILLGHILAARLHQFQFHQVLNLLNGHLTVTALGNVVSNLIQQAFILALVCVHHGLADSSHNLLLVESNDASVSLYNCLNHLRYLQFNNLQFTIY